MIYGGGSIKNNGVYDQVKEALKGHEVYEFGGVPANPEYEILINALSFIKEKNITSTPLFSIYLKNGGGREWY